jgi:tetratricopeptide (TPR) repeat protein
LIHVSYLGKYNEAIFEYDKILDIYPEEVGAVEGKGTALFNLGRYEEALTYFDKILSGDALNTRLYVAASERRQLVLDAFNKTNVTNFDPDVGSKNNGNMSSIITTTNISKS